ncbi:alpha-N-arabinofuranosidase [Dictyobacter aurantiacus]|uniref:non-reducing end alpha-L-arabinofuranosidase n=1 Tax=Dictyobacter aurantiacus TaxID=1936993 RepID=A0A401ZSN2_9CHLR|nr:alpha-L-arabinofuranosidase C-terminal domain-containing protein [Dictyobacter aurantiacus]GCE09794.1 alpha-N-arabinofuranosidase [Dictyobacter aurantiacus]
MARIKIDTARRTGTIDRNIYGGFIEHLGRCIYGGIYEEGSSLSDEHGFRKDVMEAVKGLHPPILRWPGGNFVSGYRWTDGIGPVEQRPARLELAWHSVENNHFGTDEFMRYCEVMNIEPYICVNMGTGTMDEARDWVEYCNGTGDTYWANLRRQNGHPEPYNVKYWGLGNEMYGQWQIGHLSAEDYVKKAREFAKVMKWTDPSIKLVGCGQNGWNDWDQTVIEGLAPLMDYYSLHLYTGSDDYYSNVLAPALVDFALETCQAMIERARFNQKLDHPIHIAYDEWNVWFRQRSAESALEERYDLADALAVSSYLNSFVRHSDTVKMANLAQMVNVIAPIFTSKEDLFLQTIYHPLRIYEEQMQEVTLDAYVDCKQLTLTEDQEKSRWPQSIASLGPFKVLDVSVTSDQQGHELAIAVVNRDQEEDHTTTIQFADPTTISQGRIYQVNATDPNTSNSFEHPDAVTVQERQLELADGNLTYTFPAHSLTVLRLHAE